MSTRVCRSATPRVRGPGRLLSGYVRQQEPAEALEQEGGPLLKSTGPSRHRCLALTRGGNTAWHLSSLANQVLGSSPWGANRGRKAAGRTSFWEVEPKH